MLENNYSISLRMIVSVFVYIYMIYIYINMYLYTYIYREREIVCVCVSTIVYISPIFWMLPGQQTSPQKTRPIRMTSWMEARMMWNGRGMIGGIVIGNNFPSWMMFTDWWFGT